MKSIKTLLSILAFSFVFTSCSKDDDDGPASGNGTLTAKVDGVSFNATLAVQGTVSGGALSIGGTGSAGQINIAVAGFTGAATYSVSSGVLANYTLTTSPYTSWSASMVTGTGSVVVTEYTAGDHVKGTFTFTGVNPGGAANKVVTEGQFNIEL